MQGPKMKMVLILMIIGAVSAADPNSPTVAPPQTTTEQHPTTIEPTPEPIKPVKPSDNLHFEIQSSGTICALFSFAAEIQVKDVNGSLHGDSIHLYNTTTLNEANSLCNENSTILSLNINNQAEDTLVIQLNHTGSIYKLDRIDINLQAHNSSAQFISDDVLISKIDDTKSYLCLSSSEFDLKSAPSNLTASLILKDLKIDAFRSAKDGKDFRQAEQCEADYPANDFVPLAVGCALISLVFIVLIAYIVGRKRSRRLTYQTV